MHQVLVADNSGNFVDIFKLIFKAHSIACTSCTFDSFFQEIGLLKPDLAIINVKVWGADGRDLCQQLKATPGLNHIAVLFMCVDHKKLVNYRKYQADDILEMPFEIDMLLEKVKSLLK